MDGPLAALGLSLLSLSVDVIYGCTHLPWTSSMVLPLAHIACFLLPSAPASYQSLARVSIWWSGAHLQITLQ